MVDLHMHTTNSDGTDTVEETLKKAENLKLDYISITDHDTCKGYEELKKIDIDKIYSGKIIKGIELKCLYKERTVDVLGYNIDIEKMNKWLSTFYKDKSRATIQMKNFNFLYEKCKEMGITMSKKEDIIWNPEVDWASVKIYDDFKKYSENESKFPEDLWNDFSTFTRKYCADLHYPLYIDRTGDYPSLEEAIRAIKEADGLVFMPHIFIYKWVPTEERYKFVEEIVQNYEVDGFECYYPDFSEEQKEYILNLCDKKGLYKSGGSDSHGTNKPERYRLGGQNVPTEIVKAWAK